MNPLQRALIEKAGNDNGFEHVLESGEPCVWLASARHPARIRVALGGDGYALAFADGLPALLSELRRSFPEEVAPTGEVIISGEASLAAVLRRASGLSRALPNQAATEYEHAVAKVLAELPPGISGTDVERLVRQRVGQQKFREAMLDYWGGACAVTGVAVPDVLRASHAKPWAECTTDAQRLDVFNGFLLSANLDALFDRFLISFDEQGRLLVSPTLRDEDLRCLGVAGDFHLRWIAPAHEHYLAFHRERLVGVS